MLNIPLKVDVGGGAGADYETTIDSAYDLYTTQLKNYPVANGLEFETGKFTQEFWGLQITSRSAQNTAFQSSLSLGAASGTTGLTLYSRCADFTKDIKQIVDGNLKYGLYFNGSVDFDSIQKKAYIATAGGNKFAITAYGTNIKVAPVASDGNYIGGYTETALASSDLGSSCSNGELYVAAAKGDKVWFWYLAAANSTGNIVGNTKMRGSLYTVGTDGSLTLVGHSAVLSGVAGTSTSSYNQRAYMFDSYVYNDKAYCYAALVSGRYAAARSSTQHRATEIDLSVTASFSYTTRYTHTSNDYQFNEGGTIYSASTNIAYKYPINIAYDNAANKLYYIFNNANQIWSQTTTGAMANTGQVANYSYLENYPLRTYDYLNNATGVYTNAGGIYNQSGAISGLPTQTQRDNIVNLYEITTGTQNENGQYVGTGINGFGLLDIGLTTDTDITAGVDMVLKINGVTFETTVCTPLVGTEILKDASFAQETIGAKYIQFDLVTTNTPAADHKIAFSVTGGNYATPVFNYEVSALNILL